MEKIIVNKSRIRITISENKEFNSPGELEDYRIIKNREFENVMKAYYPGAQFKIYVEFDTKSLK